MKEKVKFEYAFLQEAFAYSLADDLENTDKVVRALKGVLVQKNVRDMMTKDSTKDYNGVVSRLDAWEKHPIPSVNKDIYAICNWLRNETDEVVLWKEGIPVKVIHTTQIKRELRAILDGLNQMSGELCETLDISPTDMLKSRRVAWLKGVADRQGETG